MTSQPRSARQAILQRYQSPQTALSTTGFNYPGFNSRQNSSPTLADGDANPNSLAFWVGAIFTFLTFSHAIEFIDSQGRFHLAMLDAVLGAMALVATGLGPAMLFSKQGRWLTGFTFWVFIGLPFSMWKGGSISIFLSGYIKSYIAFFLIGGLIFSISQMRRLFVMLALGTSGLAYVTFRAGITASDDRMSATYGSLGNSNDLATNILMGMPFLVYVLMDKTTNLFLRVLAVPMALILMGIVLKTGSRGALVSMFFMGLVMFFKFSMANRVKLIALVVLLIAIFPLVVSQDLRNRYLTIFTSKEASTNEKVDSAVQSSNARRELMKHAFTLTLTHPVFGVGLGQFPMQSANLWIAKGETPLWFTSHDIYLLVSSETGIPAIVLYCLLIFSCIRDLLHLSKAGSRSEDLAVPAKMAFAIFMSLTAFIVCGVFNTEAFSMQLPMLAALTAALSRLAAPRMEAYYSAQQLLVNRTAAASRFVNRRLVKTQASTAS